MRKGIKGLNLTMIQTMLLSVAIMSQTACKDDKKGKRSSGAGPAEQVAPEAADAGAQNEVSSDSEAFGSPTTTTQDDSTDSKGNIHDKLQYGCMSCPRQASNNRSIR